MPQSKIQFTAATVQCSEAIDWEIVQVNFETIDPSFQDENKTTPYLSILANFELSESVQIEYLDGKDHEGDSLNRIDLWRNRIFAISGRGCEFDITFGLSDEEFAELRKYLKVSNVQTGFENERSSPTRRSIRRRQVSSLIFRLPSRRG
jgi:hypothetical protein